MALFPEKMKPVGTGTPTEAITALTEYIRYMDERLEMAMSNLRREYDAKIAALQQRMEESTQ